MKKLKVFAFWFAVEFVLYGMLVANGRAYVQGNYISTLITDMMISGFNFTIGKKFIENADNRSWPAFFGCVLGGGAGSCLSIFLTKILYGQ